MNDYLLVKRIKHGDEAALDEFIEKYYSSVHAYVYRIMQGNDRCNDITQEVFVRFIRMVPTFQGGSKVKRYLFMIAKNCCLDVFRETQEEDISNYDNRLSSSCHDPHDIFMKNIHKDVMETLIKQLSPQQQECLYLRYYENYKIKDISKITGVNENTVKSRLRLAIGQLKKLWEEYENEN